MPEPTPASDDQPITYQWLIGQIEQFLQVYGKGKLPEDLSQLCDKHVLREVVERYNLEVEHYAQRHPDGPQWGVGANSFKRAGYLTFWIRKLKPIRVTLPVHRHANEVLAYYLGQALVESVHSGSIIGAPRSGTLEERRKAVASFQEEFCYSLRFRPFSPHAIGLIYYAIWQLSTDHPTS